jgi:hypothetical protein
METLTMKRKRGRPTGDYSRFIGYESPLGLTIMAILETGSRKKEGPHVDAVCVLCGEHSTPRLRDVLRGHSKSGGCLKKQCYLEYCARVVERLDENVVAGVWACRYSGMTRKATADRFGLAYPIADMAQRVYQKKLDAMVADGTAEKIHNQASQPYWNIEDAAGQAGISPAAGRYLTFAAAYRRRAARAEGGQDLAPVANEPQASRSPGMEEDHDDTWWCACISASLVGMIKSRKDWSVARPAQVSFKELKRKNGRLVGEFVPHLEQCESLLARADILPEHREYIQQFVDLVYTTLASRRKRQERARNSATARNRAQPVFQQ